MTETLAVAVALVGILELVLLGCILHMARGQGRLQRRMAHLVDTMSLLAETAETGFRTVTLEVGRLAAPIPPKSASPQAVAKRIARASRRGESVRQIAVAEQMSEGEVALHLHLAEKASRPARPGNKNGRPATSSVGPHRSKPGQEPVAGIHRNAGIGAASGLLRTRSPREQPCPEGSTSR